MKSTHAPHLRGMRVSKRCCLGSLTATGRGGRRGIGGGGVLLPLLGFNRAPGQRDACWRVRRIAGFGGSRRLRGRGAIIGGGSARVGNRISILRRIHQWWISRLQRRLRNILRGRSRRRIRRCGLTVGSRRCRCCGRAGLLAVVAWAWRGRARPRRRLGGVRPWRVIAGVVPRCRIFRCLLYQGSARLLWCCRCTWCGFRRRASGAGFCWAADGRPVAGPELGARNGSPGATATVGPLPGS